MYGPGKLVAPNPETSGWVMKISYAYNSYDVGQLSDLLKVLAAATNRIHGSKGW